MISSMSQQAVQEYLSKLESKLKTGHAREHTYRPTFEELISNLGLKIHALNEPKHSQAGAPDFVFTRGDLILGYAETKDIDVDLAKIEKTEQMQRYLAGYANLILTNYLEFRFYQNGKLYEAPITIGAVEKDRIIPNTEQFATFADLLSDFLSAPPEKIKSGKRLAEIMGGKARRIRDNVRHFLSSDSEKNAELLRLYGTIRDQLVHDITHDQFADMYAQTLVYGLFVARYDDDTPETFSRREAQELIPASNPFLRSFFDHIAGVNFDRRLAYIVDELCDIFRVSTVKELIDEYYEGDAAVAAKDQIIHFYEDFLKEYDAELRKKMGAYYTPLPVVRFIVRAVDHILKTDFGLADGLADTAKLPDGRHKVQVLDPAVGTGTFISEVIGTVYRKFLDGGQKGRWPTYVHHDLLPRLYGFELMMAPYTIAHLKLSLAFKKTGFKYFNETKDGKARIQIYLTNSLEQQGQQADMFSLGFAQSIAEEAKQAAVIKNSTPIMVVLGNPPYSVSSSNKGEWIQDLIKDYKKGLGEKKINLDDDYIKFIRFAERFIEKNRSGVVAMITNNSYIDGITHRQMRKHLLETFDDIYILDLHGSSKKKERAPDGGKDENVFDIQQGVAISIFVRKEKEKQGLGIVHFTELHGTRESKFAALDASNLKSIQWKDLECAPTAHFFVDKDFSGGKEYESFIKLENAFTVGGAGIKTERDKITIHLAKNELLAVLEDFSEKSVEELRRKYGLEKDSRDWTVIRAKDEIAKLERKFEPHIVSVSYRPFDNRFTLYTGKAKHFIGTPGYKVAKNLLGRNNFALLIKRQCKQDFSYAFVVNSVAESCMFESAYANNNVYPLYIYTDDGSRVPNLKKEIVSEIEKIVGKATPEDIFDYIYAVLHSPSYREKYKEFLKIDFPRVPYPEDKKQFAALVALGRELRELHLLESPEVKKYITSYDIEGSDTVEKITRKGDKVYINAEQYFGGVPEVAWNFYIGGYQPAQKWLKDRKNRILTNEDIEHYQKIIGALTETDRIMKEINKVA